MTTKGKLHPSNMCLEGSNHSLLDRLDFFFGDPKRSMAVGEFLQRETLNFTGFDQTDSNGGLEGFALFKRYGELIDRLLTNFCEEEHMALDAVASECMSKLKQLDGAPSPCICLPYICAALEMDAFVSLVCEMKDLQNYGFDDEIDEDDDDDEEGEGEEVEGDAE